LTPYIRAISKHVPSRRVSNNDLSKTLDTSDEWIYSHTGIRYRHIAGEEEAASDLGIQAGKQVLEKADIQASDIDLVIVSSSTPDYIGGLPPTACIVQNALDIPYSGAMDIQVACGGFVYALETGRCFVQSGAAKHVLLVCTEVYSKILDWKDRSTCVLFGDAAAACVISAGEAGQTARLFKAALHSDGVGAPFLLRPQGGTRKDLDVHNNKSYLFMNGRRVYQFAIQAIITMMDMVLDMHSLSLDDISYIVPHQANQRIIEAVAKRENIRMNKFFMNIDEYANTASASVPVALADMQEKELICPGDLILVVSFGAGFVAGASIIQF